MQDSLKGGAGSIIRRYVKSLSSINENWVFTPHAAAGGPAGYKPRRGDVIFSDDLAYELSWVDAINQDAPLRIVQIQEVFGLKVRFAFSEGSLGRLLELGLHVLPEEEFLVFLRTGKVLVNG
jgi:hypothetical protein